MSDKYLKFNQINNVNDYCTLIKKFSIQSILNSIYVMSREIRKNSCSIDSLQRHIVLRDEKNGQIFDCDILIQPWQFADLAYKSITESSDSLGIIDLDSNIFLFLLLKTNEYISILTESIIQKLNSELDKSLFLYGLAGEQFKYQTQFAFYENLIRELYIIFSITKKYQSSVNPEEIIMLEMGVERKDLIFVLFGVYMDSFFHQDVNEAINYLIFDKGKNKILIFKKVIDYYSIDYNAVRNNPIGRQIFYVKPYIKTQSDSLLTVSVYFNQFIIEHAVFWIIRNYFFNNCKKEQQKFTNEFGRLFEHYLKELFIFYKIKYKKIPEDKRKRADWHIEFEDYNILIEQKSTILSLNIKQQLTDFEEYKKEVRKTIFKALLQLDTTEKDLNIKKSIKIILCYDNYIDPNILRHLFNDNDCPVANDGRYFIANIKEMEMFVELASSNYILFKTVVEDMLKRNNVNNFTTLSLFEIMKENGYNNNSYFTSSIFDEYKNLLKDFMNRHKIYKKYK